MGRYIVGIEKSTRVYSKTSGSRSPKFSIVTRVEVNGLIPKPIESHPSASLPQEVDVDGNVTADGAEESVLMTAFEVVDPVPRFLKIVSNARCCPNGLTSNSNCIEDEKSVQILHKRKSAAPVQSFSEATSVILNKSKMARPSDENIGENSGDEQIVEPFANESISKDNFQELRVDLSILKEKQRITLLIDTEKELLQFENDLSNQDFILVGDENGNTSESTNSTTPTAPDIEVADDNNVTSDENSAEPGSTDVPDLEVPNVDLENNSNSLIKMNVAVTPDLMIILELDPNLTSTFEQESSNETEKATPTENSEQSFVEPDTLFFLPYENELLDTLGKPKTTPAAQPKGGSRHQNEREERKKYLRQLILNRLLQFGTPNCTAHDITDTWYTGYVQHRVLSYRIPKIRVATKEQNKKGDEIQKPVQIKLGKQPLAFTAGYIECFLYHTNYIKGILNNATCTLLESTLYLMIPHLKTQTERSMSPLQGSGIRRTFMSDWIYLVMVAAYQLKPSEPAAVLDLIKKEFKLIKRILRSIKKETRTLKIGIQYVKDKTAHLKSKTLKRTKIDQEFVDEINRDEEPHNYGGFAHLQMAGFTGPQIFSKFLYFLTGKFGLFLKKEVDDQWFPFSDLNFLERRVIFLGLADHLYGSFDSVLITLRHLQEIYTSGYPSNLLTRLKPMFDLMKRPKPNQLLAVESKYALYSAACGCHGAIMRFNYVFKELKVMLKEATAALDQYEISVPASEEFCFKLNRMTFVNKVNMTAPFAMLNMEGFSNLAQRGICVGQALSEKEK